VEEKATDVVVNMTPWITVIGAIISWFFFVIVICIFKNFISRGFSMATAEFLLKSCDKEQCEKLVRWFANGDVILQELKEIKGKMETGKEKANGE